MIVNNYCLSMNCIVTPQNGIGALYLGNLDAAKDSQLLTQYNIGAVLQVLDQSVPVKGAQNGLWQKILKSFHFINTLNKQLNLLKIKPKKLMFLFIVMQVLQMKMFGVVFKLKKYCQSDLFQLIIQYKLNIFIYNISRSAAIVAAYLMQKYNWTVNQTIIHLQSIRRIVNPNPGFMIQLQDFQQKLSHNNQNSTLSLVNIKNESQNDQQNNPKINSPLYKSSRLDDFNNKLDQFRNQLRIKQKAF